MNEKFTSGPLKIKLDKWTHTFIINDANGKFVGRAMYRSLARKFATAPEMYNSNETTLCELENIVSGIDYACGHCDRYLMRGKRACQNCAAEKARKTVQEMKDRIFGLQQKARGEQEE